MFNPDYIPQLERVNENWYIGCTLPPSHKKWIRHVFGLEHFRTQVITEIKAILLSNPFHWQSYLTLKWNPTGLSFETDGNACGLYIDDNKYTCHNLDTYEQASIFYLALTRYLYDLFVILEMFETNAIQSDPISTDYRQILYTKIELPRFPECAKTFDQCVHKYTYVCDTCLRNPKTALIPRNNYKEFGDKFKRKTK